MICINVPICLLSKSNHISTNSASPSHFTDRGRTHRRISLNNDPFISDLTASHRVLLWPSIHALVAKTSFQAASGLRHISQMGTPWLVGLKMARHPLPLSCGYDPSSSIPDCWSDNGKSTSASLTVRIWLCLATVLGPVLRGLNDYCSESLRTCS